ncbi:RraA family protein [Dactylosporangium sp. CA-092794]|uniref:RraA family protein n=1 Tax=Dactylosporangium sp. CA-092794 TaxID=3239929 RepID=UPI003D94CC92
MTSVGIDPSHAVVSRLRELDTCVLSDALDALSLSGVVDGIRPVWEGATVAGRAYPVRMAEGPAPRDAPPVHLGARAIAACGPDDVIVVANEGRTAMGAWGGLLSAAATHRGVAGVVVDGACRDVDEARGLGFPVFARASTVRTARGRAHELASGVPVTIAGVAVAPGDYVVADGTGVVVIAAEHVERVLERAGAIVGKEAGMQAALRDGRGVTEVLGGAYEHMLSGEDGAR